MRMAFAMDLRTLWADNCFVKSDLALAGAFLYDKAVIRLVRRKKFLGNKTEHTGTIRPQSFSPYHEPHYPHLLNMRPDLERSCETVGHEI